MTIGPHDALVVVDVQNDFCPGGALAVADGDAIVPGINSLLPWFATRVFTRDWHPPGHCSFSKHPQYVDKSWPPHCIAGTAGAQFHSQLAVPGDAIVIEKGADAMKEAYSGFDGTCLTEQLRARGIACVWVCGLATDYCVKATAIDALANGFDTRVILDLCRGVDVPAGSARIAIDAMAAAGAHLVSAGDIS